MRLTFSLEETLLWTNILARTVSLQLKRIKDCFFSTYKHVAFRILRFDWSDLDDLWIIVMFYQLFGLSF